MPGYMNNPYNNVYGMQMPQNYGYSGAAPSPAPMASNVLGYQVDGDVGAKAFSIPNGANGPIVLWDMNDSVFYLRTFNQAGFPNPLEKYRFIKEEIVQSLPAGQSGNGSVQPDMSQYATKQDFEQLRQEIRSMVNNGNQNRGNSNNRNEQRG